MNRQSFRPPGCIAASQVTLASGDKFSDDTSEIALQVAFSQSFSISAFISRRISDSFH